jgi:hypothetical protein
MSAVQPTRPQSAAEAIRQRLFSGHSDSPGPLPSAHPNSSTTPRGALHISGVSGGSSAPAASVVRRMFSELDASTEGTTASHRASGLLSTLAADVSHSTDLIRQMRDLEVNKNREIEQLQGRIQLLSSKVVRLEEALNVAVRALDEETAAARCAESAERRRVQAAGLSKWRAKALARRLGRLEAAARDFETSVAASVAEGSILSSRHASNVSRSMDELASSEKQLVEERNVFLSRTAANFTTLGVESIERYVHAAKVFSAHYETVVNRRLGLVTAYIAASSDSERSCALLGTALNKFRSAWGRQQNAAPLTKAAVDLATERTAELSSAASKLDTTRDSFGSLVTILAVPPLLTALRQALHDSVGSARERRGHTSAYAASAIAQSEELSIVNATHLVASTATRFFDVLEAFVLQQPMTLQAAEAFRSLVHSHLHPNSGDSTRGVFTLQPVADEAAVRHAGHDLGAVASLVRGAVAEQKQQTHASQWRNTPFDWSLVTPSSAESEQGVPIFSARQGKDAKYISPPRRGGQLDATGGGESPSDAQRAKELIARLRQ